MKKPSGLFIPKFAPLLSSIAEEQLKHPCFVYDRAGVSKDLDIVIYDGIEINLCNVGYATLLNSNMGALFSKGKESSKDCINHSFAT